MSDIRIGKRARLYFRWFDLWVGVFYNRTFAVLYIQPIPMIGLRIELKDDRE